MVERAFQALTQEERAILDFLLLDDVPDVDALRSQAASARGRRSCDCGCPSIALEVDRNRAPRAPSWGHSDLPYPIVEAMSRPGTSSHPSWLVLFVENGWLRETELTDMDGDGSVPVFPPPAEFDGPALSHQGEPS